MSFPERISTNESAERHEPSREAMTEQRVAETLSSSDNAIKEADTALDKVRPEQHEEADQVRGLKGAVGELRERLAKAARAAGFVGGLAASALGLMGGETGSVHEAREKATNDKVMVENKDVTDESAARARSYEAQDILVKRFLATVADKLQQIPKEKMTDAHTNDEIETLSADPDKAIDALPDRSAVAGAFQKLAPHFSELPPDRQRDIIKKYAERRESLVRESNSSIGAELEGAYAAIEKIKAGLASSDPFDDNYVGTPADPEKLKAHAAEVQQTIDTMDAAIGPDVLANALKQEAEVEGPKRAARYAKSDPFSPDYVPPSGVDQSSGG